MVDHDHYCFSLDNVNITVYHMMLKLKLLTEVDSTETCSEYQNNTFLLNQLLGMDVGITTGFCDVLQNMENQQEIEHLPMNCKYKI